MRSLPPLPAMARCVALAATLLSLAAAHGAAPAQTPQCAAQSASLQTPLVELYTSEGCSSCPPADRWVASLRPEQALVAAFHVDYWDRLGWKDRFAQPRFTQRQSQQRAGSGSGFIYTPQVLVNGADWRHWPGLPADRAKAVVALQMQREDGAHVRLTVTPLPGAPARLGLWWAVLEDGLESKVAAGENRGSTLRHEHVVRHYEVMPPFTRDAALGSTWRLALPVGIAPLARRWLAVVTDASSDRPLQALQLGC